MQEMVKDINYRYDIHSDNYELYYLGDDFKVHTYKKYSLSRGGMCLILLDIRELVTQGFRYNPYLTYNN